MAKPYIYWDTSLNSDLWTRVSEGPLIVGLSSPATDTELERLQRLICGASRPVVFQDEKFGYQQIISFEERTAQHKGVGVVQQEYLPENLTFPLPGPDPFDLSDNYMGHSFRLINLGFQMFLRGWAGTMDEGGLNGQFVLEWQDEDTRQSGDARGAWTGLSLGVSNRNNGRVDHVFDILHGKRRSDLDWVFHGGHLDRVPGGPETADENTSTFNSLISANVRVVVSGGSPLWNILFQRNDGVNWVDVHSVDVDLRSHVSGDVNKVALLLSLFSATTTDQPGTLPADIFWQSIWGKRFELSQFEPWIIDIAEWSERSWDEHWRWLTGSITSYSVELERPKTDLVHYPVGTDNSPGELRISDPDLGICTWLNLDTILSATGISDNRYVDQDVGPAPQPVVVCDDELYGNQAPFAAYMRTRLLALDTVGDERTLFSFGDAYNATPSISDNGLGLSWRPTSGTMGQFVASCFDSVSGLVEIVSDEFDASEWSDVPLNIGIAWTGARGGDITRDDYELRIIVNGLTIASGVVGNFHLTGTASAFVGSDGTRDTCPMYFRAMTIFGDAISDYELERSFVIISNAFRNPSFEIADSSGRPGEAEFWNWESVQNIGGWAEFNGKDDAYDAWRTATEHFGPGWNGLENWIASFEALEAVSALFNGGSELYSAIFEMFGIWGKEWAPGWIWSGPPWRDDFVLRAPATDVLGPDTGPTGFNGWYDSAIGTNLLPMLFESFGEAFNTDPLSDSGTSNWYSGAGIDSHIEGKPLSEPITIPPDKKKFVVWTDISGVMELELTPGEYSTVSALASHLNSLLAPYYLGSTPDVMYFDTWDRDGEKGLRFGAPAVGWPTLFAGASMFGCREDEKSGDARYVLGLVEYGPGGRRNDIRGTREMLGDLHGENSDDIFCLDGWSLLEFIQVIGSGVSGILTLSYGQTPALFNSSTIAAPNETEKFGLEEWFFSGAEWHTGYESGENPGPTGLDAAMFTYDTIVSSFEKFYPYDWEEELWS